MEAFVTSMTILPDQSCSTGPMSSKATDPSATGMMSASTASLDRDRLNAYTELCGEFAEDLGAAQVGTDDGKDLHGKEAGGCRTH
jgi:hypothetical protein